MLISCLPQCHLQVGALHVKKQVGAIRRKIAKPGPGLRLCLQVITRISHGCALFLAVQCTIEGQSNLQKVPSHGVFLLEDMEENAGESVFDTESIFLRILMVGQQRHLLLAPIFSYQLCAVPPTLADEFGCLRRGNKAALMNRLGIKLSWPRSPDIVIVDGQQLLYHVKWPCGGDPSVLVASLKARLASLPGECVLVFDRYDHISPKNHERMRHAVNYNLAINSPLPSRDAILKNKHNKRQLSRVLSTFDMGAAVIIDTQDTGAFGHEEADVTIISYVLQAVGEGKNVVRVFCDDTDVFVLPVFWMWRNQLVDTCQMQIERWDGTVLDINQTCIKLGSKCLQLLGMHALTGCDTTSFPFNKGKVSALSVIEAGDFPGLFHVLGEEDAMRWDLLEVGLSFFCALYGQKQGTPMEDARCTLITLYTKTKARPRLRNLPPNSANLLLHVQRAHLQITLWKAADQHSPPDIDISNFGWEMKAGVLSPCIDPGSTGPPTLMDVISCRCRAAGKACAAICSCKKECLSCTIYCLHVNPGTNAAIPT